MKILITSAGSTNGINVIKALNGYNIISCDCDKLSAGLYMTKSYVVPKATDKNFIKEILKICKKEKINIIIPTFSKELPIFAKNKKLFDDKGIKMAISELRTYELTENKLKCNAFLNKIGVDVPHFNPDKFPIIIKPIIGSGSKNTYIIKNKKEYNFYKNKDNFSEEYIKGDEYTIDGISNLDGKFICALPRIRIEKRGGLAIKSKVVKNDYLIKLAKMIVEKFNLIGVWNIQCIKRKNKYYFIDINNRFPSGGMPLAVASGMNMPKILIELLNGKKLNIKLIYGKTMLRYYDSIII